MYSNKFLKTTYSKLPEQFLSSHPLVKVLAMLVSVEKKNQFQTHILNAGHLIKLI